MGFDLGDEYSAKVGVDDLVLLSKVGLMVWSWMYLRLALLGSAVDQGL